MPKQKKYFLNISLLLFLGLVFTGCAQLNLLKKEDKQLIDAPLIPRDILFGNPNRAAVRLSPNGEYISFLAPWEGVLNIWVGPADDPGAAEPVTFDEGRGIQRYFWAYTSDHVLYTQDQKGDENWRVYSLNVETQEKEDLTPLEGVSARVQEVSQEHPKEILVGLNNRDQQYHDVHRVNIITGERELVRQNDQFRGFTTDDQFRIRFASKYQSDGSVVYMQPDGNDGWKEYMKVPEVDTLNTGIGGFDKSGNVMYLYDSRGRNTTALKAVNLETGEEEIVAEDPRTDIGGILTHPTEKTIQAVSFTYLKKRWEVLDEDIAPDMEYLRELHDGEITITSRTQDDSRWIVAYIQDDGPVVYYMYNRNKKEAEFLFTNREELEDQPLAPMHPVVIKSRDGLDLVSYYTLPPGTEGAENGRPKKPLPTILLVHGGPWARDEWGYNSQHQLLANRGYAVLSVNFRGSTGFGKDFLNAGKREWGGKMHDDLIDAVDWAIEERIAAPDKVAIMGGSYGGYATLVGLTFTPGKFACGVDIVGPSNLITLLETIPPYWGPALEMFKSRVGDHTTEEGREFLRSRSPLTHVENIEDPLLIAQGANDPRVKQSEADQIVNAMKEKNIPVTYALYPDEGHGFARPENRISFMAVTEAFLAEQLGGRFEPIKDAFEGASITVPTGTGEVPGLQEALKETKENSKP